MWCIADVFSAFTLFVWYQKEHLASKNLDDKVLAWLSVWSNGEIAYGPADAIAAPSSCALLKSRKVILHFTLLVLADPDYCEKEAVKSELLLYVASQCVLSMLQWKCVWRVTLCCVVDYCSILWWYLLLIVLFVCDCYSASSAADNRPGSPSHSSFRLVVIGELCEWRVISETRRSFCDGLLKHLSVATVVNKNRSDSGIACICSK